MSNVLLGNKWLRLSTAAMLVVIANCSRPGEQTDKARTLHIGNMVEPLSLDPHKASASWENRIIGELLMGLIAEDPQGRPIPGMAKEWTTSNDGLVWTFKLREATWSDGVPVTAHDFVYGWQKIMTASPPSEYASLLYVIKNAEKIFDGTIKDVNSLGVKAYDDSTLIVTLEHPTPYLLGLLTHYTSYPIPKHVVEKVGTDWVKPENYVSNGPFKLVDWKANNYVHVTRNPRFWDDANVCLRDLYFYPTTDEAAAAERVRTGELDVNTNFIGSQIGEITKTLPGFVRVHGYTGIAYAAINTRVAPFGDVRAREALSIAIDREFITREHFKTGQQAAYSLVPPGVANYRSGAARLSFQGQPFSERLARAKTLLEQAGYGPSKPLRFTFSYRQTGSSAAFAGEIEKQWEKIAPWVQVETLGLKPQISYEKLRKGEFEIGETGWIADFNDAKNFNFLFETSSNYLNSGGYSNPRFDALMAKADREKDVNKREAFMQNAEAILMQDHALIPLWFVTSRNLVNPRITGWVDNPVDIHRARYLCTTEANAKK